MSRPGNAALVCTVLGVAAVATAVSGYSAQTRSRIEPAAVVEDIRYLTSDDLRGRGTGSPGLDKAAEYIARQFAAAGLRPVNGSSYLQPFEVSTGAAMRGQTSVSYTLAGSSTTLGSEDFLPFNFSGIGRVSGQVVFAGYGITAPEYGYDDYAGVDVRGKIVLILRHEPQEYEAASVFEGRVYTEHSQLLSKALNARAHGAAGIVFVADTASHSGSDAFEPFTSYAAPGDAGLPYVQVKADVTDRWFRQDGRDFLQLQRDIDSKLAPASFAFTVPLEVQIQVDIERAAPVVNNVAGYLPGKTKEYVIVGAHYDHLGTGEQYSLANDSTGAVHPGADDNASGAAGVLALARSLSKMPQPSRGILFITFAGEEIGLLGSSHYIRHPLLSLGDAVAMINMDMIGRMRDRKVIVGGLSSGDGLRAMVERVAKPYHLDLDTLDGAVYGSSDHTAFKARSIPVLFFFTGLHADYHRPSDTWDKIEGRGIAQLLDLVADITLELCRQSGRPRFVGVPPRKKPDVAASAPHSEKYVRGRSGLSR